MQKAWYKDKEAVTAILTALAGLYVALRLVFPALPDVGDKWVGGIIAALGIFGWFNRATDQAKPKLAWKSRGIHSFLLAAMLLGMTVPAHADLFGDRSQERLVKSSLRAEEPTENLNAPLVEWGSIADILAALAGQLGVKEGTFFDWEAKEFRNYLATTLYTIPEAEVAFNVGMIDTDGVLGSVDWNIGSAISQEDVPILSLFQYLYIGYGAGFRDQDGGDTNIEEAGDWEFVHGPTVVFKATF